MTYCHAQPVGAEPLTLCTCIQKSIYRASISDESKVCLTNITEFMHVEDIGNTSQEPGGCFCRVISAHEVTKTGEHRKG